MYCINYVIKQGDTLYSISRHYNIPLDAIMAANPLVDVYNLRIDEVLCIPVSVPQNNYTQNTTYLVEEGDTLGSILMSHGINLADLMELNQLDQIYLLPGSTIQVPVTEESSNEMTL